MENQSRCGLWTLSVQYHKPSHCGMVIVVLKQSMDIFIVFVLTSLKAKFYTLVIDVTKSHFILFDDIVFQKFLSFFR